MCDGGAIQARAHSGLGAYLLAGIDSPIGPLDSPVSARTANLSRHARRLQARSRRHHYPRRGVPRSARAPVRTLMLPAPAGTGGADASAQRLAAAVSAARQLSLVRSSGCDRRRRPARPFPPRLVRVLTASVRHQVASQRAKTISSSTDATSAGRSLRRAGVEVAAIDRNPRREAEGGRHREVVDFMRSTRC
jgi:hypothetical protein